MPRTVVEEQFDQQIRPILEDYCYACHGNGLKKGGVALDAFGAGQARLRDHDLWWRVLKNVRAGIMPPAGKPRPTDEERRLLEDWIKYAAFGIDPENPDPGRVTVRRLNRVEYRNTVRDLSASTTTRRSSFRPMTRGTDSTILAMFSRLSPLLLEKYVTAAKAIVSAAVPHEFESRRGADDRRPAISRSANARKCRERRRASRRCRITSRRLFRARFASSMPAATSLSWI